MITVNDPRLVSLFDAYHDKHSTNDTLYHYGVDGVQVHLPRNLVEYANAGSGVLSADNPEPRGIRVMGVKPAEYLAKIFSSHSSLADFLNSSECNANGYVASTVVRRSPSRRTKTIDLSAIPAAGNLYTFFAGDDVRSLAVKLGGAEAFQAYLATRSIADVVAEQGLVVKEGAKAPTTEVRANRKSVISWNLGF